MQQYLDQLQRCPLFSSVAPEALSPLLSCLKARVLHYPKGSTILQQGEPAHSIGILLCGGAQILRGDIHGSHSIVEALQPTELFGEIFACAALEALPVTVIANEDSTVLFLEHSRVLNACSSGCRAHSQLVTALLRLIARKTLLLNQKLEIVTQRTTKEKLLAYLQAQRTKTGSARFTIPFDRQQLADFLGVERSAMSTELNKLKKAGMIDFSKNDFFLPDPPAGL